MIRMGVPVEDEASGHRKGDDNDGCLITLSVPRHEMAAYALGPGGLHA